MPTNALDHIAMLTETLREIANGCDCDYVDYPKDRPNPCTCSPCRARHALATATAWRYYGARHERVTSGWNPRETAVVEAWSKAVDDRRLAQILNPDAPDDRQRAFVFHETLQPPTARDWFVATSVVQWLVTNVGQEVLRSAGWEYTTWHGVIALHGEHAGEIAFHGSCVEGGCGPLLEDAEVIGRSVFVLRNKDGSLVRVTVPPRLAPAVQPAAPSRDAATTTCRKCGGDREECGGCPAHL